MNTALFGAATASGEIQIWDLNKSWQVPEVSVVLTSEAALTTFDWVLDGKRFLSSTSSGSVLSAAVPEAVRRECICVEILAQLSSPEVVSGDQIIFETNLEQAKTRAAQKTWSHHRLV